MKYKNVVTGIFIKRPNRFIAHVEINGIEEICHVKNTGRCKELLIPGATVWLEKSDNPNRKTAYDVIAVYKEPILSQPGQIINFDSQVPNIVAKEWLERNKATKNITFIKPEKKYGDSRVDLYYETGDGKKGFIEVKGVTLENDGIASFPDAPTQRGIKHLKELKKAVDEGYEATILFVIQMKHIKYITPNRDMHPEFAETLKEAALGGVNVIAYDCIVTADSIEIDNEVKVRI